MANYIEEVATDIDQISVGDSILVGDLNSLQVYSTKFNNSLKILVQNIRSLNKNFTDFEVFLARCKVNYDVIVLTECWLQYNNNVPELESFRHFSTTRYLNQNSGVVVYVRENLNAQFSIIAITSAALTMHGDGTLIPPKLINQQTSAKVDIILG
ncbi:hypothetical protein ACJJTC_012412 [Scirpophaga incertulas]